MQSETEWRDIYRKIDRSRKTVRCHVNSKVATIATEVGKTPESWNSSVFSIILTLSRNVVVPIAGLVIAAVLTYELISMIIEKNNMHDIDTFMFFKWAFKSAAAAIIVNHTFDFIMAIFQVAQTMVQRSAGVIDTNASTASSSNKADTGKDPSAVSPVAIEETEDNPFTPDGSATVVDNATDEQGKEFYTIMTPDENVFYLIIDKQRDGENVYFLNAVTESDLMALAQKDTDSQTVTPTAPSEPEPAAPAEPEEPSAPETPETEPEQPAPKSNNSMMFLVIVAALAAGGLGYYFKVYKPKHDLDDAEDIISS